MQARACETSRRGSFFCVACSYVSNTPSRQIRIARKKHNAHTNTHARKLRRCGYAAAAFVSLPHGRLRVCADLI